MPKGLKGFQKGNKIALGNKNSLGKIPWNKGIPRTKEEKLKMSLSKKGKKFTIEQKARMKFGQHLIGKKQCPETIAKRVSKMMGENHPHWQGGKSFEPYTVDWTNTLKRSIRERDYYTCQMCKKPQGDITLHVHHIDYNKKNCNPDNLISLCVSCHIKTNHNRVYWENYFKTS